MTLVTRNPNHLVPLNALKIENNFFLFCVEKCNCFGRQQCDGALLCIIVCSIILCEIDTAIYALTFYIWHFCICVEGPICIINTNPLKYPKWVSNYILNNK